MLVPALQHISMGFPDYAEWVSWILSIYLLVGAVLNPVAGELADLYGKRKMLIVTLAIYTIGLTGRALTYSNFICLIAFRAMQRIGLTMFRLSGGSIGPVLGTAILPAPLSSRLSD
ncbi:MAG: MFS transporter [Candidatus Methanomethylophilaceae archaeon]